MMSYKLLERKPLQVQSLPSTRGGDAVDAGHTHRNRCNRHLMVDLMCPERQRCEVCADFMVT
jgi:predicted phosphodiesterase